MRASRIYRVHNKIHTKRKASTKFTLLIFAVSDGEWSFMGDQLRSGRFALKSARAPRQDRVAHWSDTWMWIFLIGHEVFEVKRQVASIIRF